MKKKFIAVLILPIVALGFLFNIGTVRAYATEPAKRPGWVDNSSVVNIKGWETIYNMTTYGRNNDGGCGFTAMSILLQFYNELETCNKGRYIIDKNYNYNHDEVWKISDETEREIEALKRATALRNDVKDRTPKVIKNATVPAGQSKGLNSYFDTYCSGLNVEAAARDVLSLPNLFGVDLEDYVKSQIRDNIPVMITMTSYHDPIDNADYKKAEDMHIVIAYGYKETSAGIEYLCHAGWVGTKKIEGVVYTYRDVFFSKVSLYGAVSLNAPTQHESSQISTLSSGHKGEICGKCGRENVDYGHNYTKNAVKIDDTYHIATCACGASSTLPHNITLKQIKDDKYYHIAECAECGYAKTQSHLYSVELILGTRITIFTCIYCRYTFESSDRESVPIVYNTTNERN